MSSNQNIYYTNTHEWVQMIDEKSARIGITDFAQNELSDIIFVELPETGTILQTNDVFGSVEAVKTVTDLLMPVAGTIIDTNQQLTNEPELVNSSPLDKGWMIKIELNDPKELQNLLTETEYKALCEKSTLE